jgi:outer membrane protein
MLLIFRVKRKQTVELGQQRSRIQKEQQLSYAQQALSQQLQQESGTEMDTLVSGVKNSSKHTVKKRILYLRYG